jgi:hypothetical protein
MSSRPRVPVSAYEEEAMKTNELRSLIENAPLPCEGEEPWKALAGRPDEAYELVARILAHALLVLVEESDGEGNPLRPDLLEGNAGDKLRQAFTERWPEGSEWLGGPTGLQFAAAQNALHALHGKKPVKLALPGEAHPSVLILSLGDGLGLS